MLEAAVLVNLCGNDEGVVRLMDSFLLEVFLPGTAALVKCKAGHSDVLDKLPLCLSMLLLDQVLDAPNLPCMFMRLGLLLSVTFGTSFCPLFALAIGPSQLFP